MKRTAILLVALAGALASQARDSALAPKPEKAAARLRVGSYNIRCTADAGTPNAWRARRGALVKLVEKMDCDAIGLQEVTPEQARFLSKALPQFATIGEFRNADRRSGEASPILFRKDRFNLLDSGTFWLSATPEKPGSKGWGANLPRVCTWALLEDRRNGAKFCFANTHLDHQSSEARKEGMRLIVEKRLPAIAGRGTPAILTGDFNCLETDEPALLAAKHLDNALCTSETAPKGPWRTYTGWSWKETETPCEAALRKTAAERNALVRSSKAPFEEQYSFGGPRIDFIFVSKGVKVESFTTYGDTRKGRKLYPSDHFPLAATITLPAKGK